MIRLYSHSIEDDLEALFRAMFEQALEDKDVSLSVKFVQDGETSGKDISVRPRNSFCAPIGAFCENGGEIIYITIGRNTQLEVPIEGKRYTEFENAEELIALLHAVVAGKFEETVWETDKTAVKSVGKIFIDNSGPITIKTYTLNNPFVALIKKEYQYLPYSQSKNWNVRGF